MTFKLLGLTAVTLLSGCVGALCRGAGCESVYPAGQLLLMATPLSGTQVASPATAVAALSGTADHGSNWNALAFDEDALYVGMPEFERVVRWRAEADDDSVLDSTDNWRAPFAEFGAQVVPFNPGSGTPALWVSAPGANLDTGAAILWTRARTRGRLSDATLALHGGHPSDRFGEELLVCGNLTAGERPYLLVAAPHMSAPAELGGGAHAGAVFLVRPQAELTGIKAFADWQPDAQTWVGTANAALGSSLACGDLTGDGIDDIVIGAPGAGEGREGAFWVLSGTDLPASGSLGDPTATGSAGSWLGTALAIGDLDGDTVGDLAVGAAGANDGAGEVQVYYGPDFALPRTVIEPQSHTELTHLGRELLITTFDDDAFDDLVVGAEDWADGEAFDAGYIGIWQGEPARLGANLELGTDETWSFSADHPFQRLGGSMSAHELGLVTAVRSRGF